MVQTFTLVMVLLVHKDIVFYGFRTRRYKGDNLLRDESGSKKMSIDKFIREMSKLGEMEDYHLSIHSPDHAFEELKKYNLYNAR